MSEKLVCVCLIISIGTISKGGIGSGGGSWAAFDSAHVISQFSNL